MQVQIALASAPAKIVNRGVKIRGYNIARNGHILLSRSGDKQAAIKSTLDSYTKQHGNVVLQLFLTVEGKDTFQTVTYTWNGREAVPL